MEPRTRNIANQCLKHSLTTMVTPEQNCFWLYAVLFPRIDILTTLISSKNSSRTKYMCVVFCSVVGMKSTSATLQFVLFHVVSWNIPAHAHTVPALLIYAVFHANAGYDVCDATCILILPLKYTPWTCTYKIPTVYYAVRQCSTFSLMWHIQCPFYTWHEKWHRKGHRSV